MKRGLSMVPLKFELDYTGSLYTVLASIYAGDGTVAISHGGVECGQGVDTKVCQVAALRLGVPLEMIKIKPCSTLTNPNSTATGGSITSELSSLVNHMPVLLQQCLKKTLNLQGTIRACEMLTDRMKPVKDKNPDATWKELVSLCFAQSIDLSAKY